MAYIARHVIGMPLNSIYKVVICESMTWRAISAWRSLGELYLTGPTSCISHVIGCHVPQETRVQNTLDNEASNGPGRLCSPRHRTVPKACRLFKEQYPSGPTSCMSHAPCPRPRAAGTTARCIPSTRAGQINIVRHVTGYLVSQ